MPHTWTKKDKKYLKKWSLDKTSSAWPMVGYWNPETRFFRPDKNPKWLGINWDCLVATKNELHLYLDDLHPLKS